MSPAKSPTKSPAWPLKPGSTVGILGGGQLARMLALAAAPLGLRCHIYAPDADSPAFEVSAARTVAAYADEAALSAFAGAVDVVTYEFENVPAETVAILERLVPARPGARALAVTQDRIAEKTLARGLGAGTAAFAPVSSRAELDAALAGIGLPAVLKTTRLGYDGKGQFKLSTPAQAEAAWAAMAGAPAILEAFVPFAVEVSVVAARTADGGFAAFDVVENLHRDHILHVSRAPARLSAQAAAEAVAVARRLGDALDYVGVFAVEFFVLDEGGSQRVLVNEIAPRVHNSGHWTIEGAATSQFAQHIRAVAGWPLGSTERRAEAVTMTNLIGHEAEVWREIAAEPGAALHLYGKAQARPGRKMGHVTRLHRS